MLMKHLALGMGCIFATALSVQLGAAAGDPALIEAVKNADIDTVRSLVRDKVDVNAPAVDGSTALHWAAQKNDVEAVTLLIDAGADVEAANRYGVKPVMVACSSGSSRVVETLLKAGADANVSLPEGETALMTCARTGNVPALKALVAHGADVNATEGWFGQTALMWAAAREHTEAVQLLLDSGADVHARSTTQNVPDSSNGAAGRVNTSGGMTPLMFAVRAGDLDTIKVLLAGGASLDEKATDGTALLMLSVINAHYDLAAWLLDNGADPNAPDARGSALHVLGWLRRPPFGVGMGSSTVRQRVTSNELDALGLAKKLLDHGANPNARITLEDAKYTRNALYYVQVPTDVPISLAILSWSGATPFWVAAKSADAPYMRLLAANGADPSIPNWVNVTPLMAAAGAGFEQGEHPGTEREALEATRAALELGNDVNAVAEYGDVDNADTRFSGATALHGAAQRGATSIVSYLVENGAKLDLETREGWTPLGVADGIEVGGSFKSNPEAAALLRKIMEERGMSIGATGLDRVLDADGRVLGANEREQQKEDEEEQPE